MLPAIPDVAIIGDSPRFFHFLPAAAIGCSDSQQRFSGNASATATVAESRNIGPQGGLAAMTSG